MDITDILIVCGVVISQILLAILFFNPRCYITPFCKNAKRANFWGLTTFLLVTLVVGLLVFWISIERENELNNNKNIKEQLSRSININLTRYERTSDPALLIWIRNDLKELRRIGGE